MYNVLFNSKKKSNCNNINRFLVADLNRVDKQTNPKSTKQLLKGLLSILLKDLLQILHTSNISLSSFMLEIHVLVYWTDSYRNLSAARVTGIWRIRFGYCNFKSPSIVLPTEVTGLLSICPTHMNGESVCLRGR